MSIDGFLLYNIMRGDFFFPKKGNTMILRKITRIVPSVMAVLVGSALFGAEAGRAYGDWSRRVAEVTDRSQIKFPAIAKPLQLSETESLTGKTFAQLIRESFRRERGYVIAVISSGRECFFYDAETYRSFGAQGDDSLLEFSVSSVNAPPQQLAGVSLEWLNMSGVFAPGDQIIVSDDHVVAIPSSGIASTMSASAGLSAADAAREEVDVPVSAAFPSRKAQTVEVQVSAPVLEYDELAQFYGTVSQRLNGNLENRVPANYLENREPANYRMNIGRLKVSIPLHGSMDSNTIIELLQGSLLQAMRDVLTKQPIGSQFEKARQLVKEKVLSSDILRELSQAGLVTSVVLEDSDPFVYVANVSKPVALIGCGAPAHAAKSQFHLDVNGMQIDSVA
jgi:hypothetical protein